MMKNFFLTVSLSSVLLFSGCTIPFVGNEGNSEIQEVTKADATQLSQENPEQLFFDFAKASGAKTMEKINKAIPDKEIFIKNEGEVSIDGDFNMEGTPVGGGTGTFALKVNAQSDYSDEKNPLFSESIDVNVNALGGLIKVQGNGDIRVVKNSFFTRLNSLDLNIPMIDQKMVKTIQKFVGQWYGNSFDEIKELAGKDLESVDFNKLLTGSSKIITLFNLIEDISTTPENHITFGKFKEEKDGYFFFEVTPKKETYEQFGKILTEIIPVIGTDLDKIKEDIQKSIDELSPQKIIIGYTPENSEYFKISNITGDIRAEKTSEGILIQLKNKETDDVMVFKKTGENFSYTITNGETTNEFFNGIYSDKKLTFNVFSESYNSETNTYILDKDAVIVGSFTKENNAWSGEITSQKLKEGKLIFTNCSFSTKKIEGKISAQYETNTIGNINFLITSRKPDSVSISAPENVKTFQEAGDAIKKEINALNAIDTTNTTPQIDTKQAENKAENKKENNNDKREEVPNPDTIPTTPPVPTNIDISSDSGDTKEIEAIMGKMAIMMQDAPTEETQKEFMKLAESVDALAKKQNISEEEIKALFQKVMKGRAAQIQVK